MTTRVRDLARVEVAARMRGVGLPIECGPLLMRLGSRLPELVDAVSLLYGDFPVVVEHEGARAICDFDARVDPAWRWPGTARFRVRGLIDGRTVFEPFPRRHALPMFEWAINWSVFTRPNQYLMLHAGVVERGGKALILSGRPGAGKSTLTAALVLRGWRLLSDEVALIPPGTRNLLPLPRPVSLKERSIDLVRRSSPDAVIGPLTPGTKKGTVAHLKPPVDSVVRAHEPAVAAWLVFPWFGAGYETTLQPISRAKALLRAGQEAFNYSMLGAVGFETLADVVDGMACYDLPFSDLDAALEALEALPASPPPEPGRALVEQVGAHA